MHILLLHPKHPVLVPMSSINMRHQTSPFVSRDPAYLVAPSSLPKLGLA